MKNSVIAHVVVDTWQYDGGEQFIYACTNPEKALIELQRVRREVVFINNDYYERYGSKLYSENHLVHRLEALKIVEREIILD